MNIKTHAGLFTIALGALMLAACASVPLPNDALQAADIAIANAETEKAADFAPAELKAAHDKMAAARDLVAKDPTEKDVAQARKLADEAQADAELASARTRDGHAQAVNAELQKNIDTLNQELQRNTGNQS